MASETKKRFRFSLSTNILMGLLLGVVTGLCFGDDCARLQIIGDAFVKLLILLICTSRPIPLNTRISSGFPKTP